MLIESFWPYAGDKSSQLKIVRLRLQIRQSFEASYIDFHCFQFSDKLPPKCSLGGNGTLDINDDDVAPFSSGEALGTGALGSSG